MQVFVILLLILSVMGAVFFLRKNDPPYIIAACLALALICFYVLVFSE